METQELPANQAGGTPAPNPEVEPRPSRRTYSARFKLQILKETDALPQGETGAYLRRNMAYPSKRLTDPSWENPRRMPRSFSLVARS